jgi:hypothetical protein
LLRIHRTEKDIQTYYELNDFSNELLFDPKFHK